MMYRFASTAALSLSAAMMSSTLVAQTSPDVVIAIEGTPTVTMENGVQHLDFNLRFTNNGTPVNATLKTKALLFPINDYEANPGVKGVVLPVFDVAVNLPTGGSLVHPLHLALPVVPSHDYLLGAVTDLLQVSGETFEAAMNNATPDLVEIGHLENQIVNDTRDPIHGIDVYHEVHSKFDLRNGRATHRSRMIMRGDRNTVPWNNTIWARFMTADIDNRTLKMNAYSGQTIDKYWGAISWNAEHDVAGRAIQVDYYTNAPSITTGPGKHVMAILLNSRDLLPEPYPENNLDLTAMTISTPALQGGNQIWLVSNGTSSAQQTLSFQTPMDVSVQARAYEISSLNFLTISTLSGTFSGFSAVVNTPVALSSGLQPGRYEGNLEIVENGNAAFPTIVPVKAFVQDSQVPAMSLSSTNVVLTSQQGINPMPSSFTITNTGTADLEFSLFEDEPWLFLSPRDGVVMPGQTATITVSGNQYGLRPMSTAAQVFVYSNTATTMQRLTVNYQVTARTNP